MADKKISQLTTLVQADVATTADFVPIVDTSAVETKKVTPQALVQAGATGATLALADGSAAAPALTNTGDENTGIFFPAADTIAFAEGGVESMRLDSSGNLGIGTTSPGARLEVNGNIAVGGSLGTTPSLNRGIFVQSNTNNDVVGYSLYVNDGANGRRGSMFLDDATGLWGWDVTASSGIPSYVWRVATAEVMRLNDSGNLGIGTASPGARLQVKSSLAQAVNIEGTTARGSGGVYAAFLDPTGRKGYVGYASGADDSLFLFNEMNAPLVFGTNASERMRIDASGNVGIRTNTFGTSAVGVIGIANGTAPTTSPAGMGQLYVEAGALKYRGSSGTITTIANA